MRGGPAERRDSERELRMHRTLAHLPLVAEGVVCALSLVVIIVGLYWIG